MPATKPPKLTADRQEQLRRLAATGEPVRELAAAFGIGRATAYRYLTQTQYPGGTDPDRVHGAVLFYVCWSAAGRMKSVIAATKESGVSTIGLWPETAMTRGSNPAAR